MGPSQTTSSKAAFFATVKSGTSSSSAIGILAIQQDSDAASRGLWHRSHRHSSKEGYPEVSRQFKCPPFLQKTLDDNETEKKSITLVSGVPAGTATWDGEAE